MFALPKQTLEQVKTDVQIALEQNTTHLSFYELTLEPNTLFARFPPTIPDSEVRACMQEEIVAQLATSGFERYEVSAYARASERSHNRANHNINYWQFGDYVGIGCGAHGKISSADSGSIVRRWKHKHPRTYLEANNAQQRLGEEKLVPVQDTAFEFMMNALRLKEGFALPLFELHTGVSLDHWQQPLQKAMDRGLLEQAGLQIRATELGYNWLNDTLALFLPEHQNTRAARYKVIPLNLEKK